MGAKRMPTMNSVGRTVRGVRMGCHAFSRCCLNAVSGREKEQVRRQAPAADFHASRKVTLTRRSPPAALFLLPLALIPVLLAVEYAHRGSDREAAKPVQRRKGNRGQPGGMKGVAERWERQRAMSAGGAKRRRPSRLGVASQRLSSPRREQ